MQRGFKQRMRAVVQLVNSASVRVGGEVISSIGRGMLVLVGVCHEDQLQEDAEYIARKMLNMRIFPSIPSLEGSIKPTDTPQTSVNEGESVEGRRWEKSAKELGLEILCVSQFTLHSLFKGNRLDFHRAMPGEDAQRFYSDFLSLLRKQYGTEGDSRVKDGRFGAKMVVSLENDGPVTVLIDSRARKGE